MKKITLENGTVVEISDERYEALAKGVKTKKPWRAKDGGTYWFVRDWGGVATLLEDEDLHLTDDYRYLTGNYYRTEEEAEKALERQEAIGRVTHRIYELNDGWEPDWLDEDQEKHYIWYKHNDKLFGVARHYWAEKKTVFPWVASEEIAKQIIAEMEDDLKIIWGL